MKNVEKKHRAYEIKVQNAGFNTMPSHVNNQEEIESLVYSRDSFASLIVFGTHVKSMLQEMYPEETVSMAIWKFDGHYHNTVLDHAKHWGEMSHETNYRIAIHCGPVKMEFKELDMLNVELWSIMVADKNKGTGTKIMTGLMDIAEQKQFTLSLVACSQGEPNYAAFIRKTIKLRNWYHELGFEYVDGSGYMTW